MKHASTLELVGLLIAAVCVYGLVKFILAVPRMVLDAIKLFLTEYLAVMLWRHFTGAHYHGERRTDATWFRHGSESSRKYDKDGFMSRWEHKPRAHRALWRWFLTFAFLGLTYGLIEDFAVTVNAVESAGVYLVVLMGFSVEAKIRLRAHRRHVLNPIEKSLAAYLRTSPHAVRRALHIDPENITDDGEIGWYEMPPEMTPGADQQAGMERIIDAHLAVDSELVFKMEQAPKIAVVMAAQKPPGMVLWDETVAAMETAAAGDIIIGKDRLKNIFRANFIHLDDPHWAFCVQSKRGKSNFLGLVAVQVMHQDPNALIIALDPKRSSLIDYLGSPDYPGPGLKPMLKGVTMANDPTRPEEMVGVILRAKKLFDARSEEASRDRTKQFPTCLVIIDELNLLREIINDMWGKALADNKRLDKADREDLPTECPIWPAIRTLLQAGRFVGIHVIAVAQDLRDDALGGKGARNYFGLRGLGGFHASQWKMLVDRNPVPVAQKGVGRWLFVQGEEQDWVQITYADPDKAYAWAAHGRELHTPDMSVPEDDALPYAGSILSTQTDGQPADDDVIVGRRAGFEHLEPMGMPSQEAFNKARDRRPVDKEFKRGSQPAWHAADLEEWYNSRPGRLRLVKGS